MGVGARGSVPVPGRVGTVRARHAAARVRLRGASVAASPAAGDRAAARVRGVRRLGPVGHVHGRGASTRTTRSAWSCPAASSSRSWCSSSSSRSCALLTLESVRNIAARPPGVAARGRRGRADADLPTPRARGRGRRRRARAAACSGPACSVSRRTGSRWRSSCGFMIRGRLVDEAVGADRDLPRRRHERDPPGLGHPRRGVRLRVRHADRGDAAWDRLGGGRRVDRWPCSLRRRPSWRWRRVSYATHRWVMHGPGMGWHRSHHRPPAGRWERNDLFPLCFSVIGFALFAGGAWGPHLDVLTWAGVGVTVLRRSRTCSCTRSSSTAASRSACRRGATCAGSATRTASITSTAASPSECSCRWCRGRGSAAGSGAPDRSRILERSSKRSIRNRL